MLCYLHVCDSEFERSACGVLTELHERDLDMSKELMTKTVDTWNNTDIFTLADDYSDGVKMHDCFQAKLDEMWFGVFVYNTRSWVKMHF